MDVRDLPIYKIVTNRVAILFLVVLLGFVATSTWHNVQSYLAAVRAANEVVASKVDLNQLLVLTNQTRAAAKLPPLASESNLAKSALNECNDMVANDYYAYTSPRGKKWSDFIGSYYPTYAKAASQIYVTVASGVSARSVVQQWKGETNTNLLDKDVTLVGFAACNGTYQGSRAVYAVANFLKPAPAPASTATGQAQQSHEPAAAPAYTQVNPMALQLALCNDYRNTADSNYRYLLQGAQQLYDSNVAWLNPAQTYYSNELAKLNEQYDASVTEAYSNYTAGWPLGCTPDMLMPILK